jgi:putative photosynthetic complex assembly protein 2
VADHGLPLLYAVFLWWFSTGLILYLDGLPQRTFRWSMAGCTALALASFLGMAATRDDTSVVGAYAGFTYGLLIWGWHEMSFLMGMVTGPRRTACPEGCRGWRHLGHAIQAILWHELAIAATAAVMVALTWGAANQVATWTFLVLWVMRLSAKLNVYLGVPNLTEEFLPPHLHYLRSFLRRKPMNLLFPLSVTVATVVAADLVGLAVSADATAFDAVAYTFVAMLLALAILEHWFLILPLPDAALWSWALRSRATDPNDERSAGLPATAPLPTFAALAAHGRRP